MKRAPKEIAEEKKLLADYKKSGDIKLVGDLFNPYLHLVYGVCLKYLKSREDSQDAVMQIFEKISQELLAHEVDNFKSWLHVLTKNFCLMKIRSEKSRLQKEESLKKDIHTFMESSYELHHDNGKALDSDLVALRECIEKLKDVQRQCVSLFYIEEKCYKDISEIAGLEIKKVKSYIQNGKRNLKICLENKNVKR